LLVVEDDGVGVPDAFREVIFEPFQRVDTSRDRGTGGFGVGLAIVKKVAQWHAGRCYVETSELGGAKFTFVLPK